MPVITVAMRLLEEIYSIRYPIMWALFIGGAILLVLIGSGVRVPGLERKIAVSDETRDAAATANAPTISRQDAIERVREFLQSDCSNGAAYLENDPGFTAVFMSSPVTDDHHVRGTDGVDCDSHADRRPLAAVRRHRRDCHCAGGVLTSLRLSVWLSFSQ